MRRRPAAPDPKPLKTMLPNLPPKEEEEEEEEEE
eukprot:COSAG06_NODE_20649_length_786_cov_1.917031_1_plen_33_part_10